MRTNPVQCIAVNERIRKTHPVIVSLLHKTGLKTEKVSDPDCVRYLLTLPSLLLDTDRQVDQMKKPQYINYWMKETKEGEESFSASMRLRMKNLYLYMIML